MSYFDIQTFLPDNTLNESFIRIVSEFATGNLIKIE